MGIRHDRNNSRILATRAKVAHYRFCGTDATENARTPPGGVVGAGFALSVPNCARRSRTYNVDGASDSMIDTIQIRNCFREPIPEIADAARYLDAAVSSHLVGRRDLADQLIRLADIRAIREWTESLWGSNSRYVRRGPSQTLKAADTARVAERMPTAEQRRQLHLRDGYHCRFCGIPVIRAKVRKRIGAVYPDALRWGTRNVDQHTAFQAMWAQYDHVVPHALGGTNELQNIVIACAPCNFARMNCSLEDAGIADPRTRTPMKGSWDGLERFH